MSSHVVYQPYIIYDILVTTITYSDEFINVIANAYKAMFPGSKHEHVFKESYNLKYYNIWHVSWLEHNLAAIQLDGSID